MYNFPSSNPINGYTYKDLESLFPIYIGYQEQYYNTYQQTALSQRVNDPSNKGPSKQPLFAMGQMKNYDHLYNPVNQNKMQMNMINKSVKKLSQNHHKKKK